MKSATYSQMFLGEGKKYLYIENGRGKKTTQCKYDKQLNFLDKECIDVHCAHYIRLGCRFENSQNKSLRESQLTTRSKCMEACSTQSTRSCWTHVWVLVPVESLWQPHFLGTEKGKSFLPSRWSVLTTRCLRLRSLTPLEPGGVRKLTLNGWAPAPALKRLFLSPLKLVLIN